jgi:hypothetical protein
MYIHRAGMLGTKYLWHWQETIKLTFLLGAILLVTLQL